MLKKIFFNASLPRSGSTLLQNILAQNSAIYATPTSGLYELIEASREIFTGRPEFAAQNVDLMNRAFAGYCKGAISGFCNELTHKDYLIDKSFHWASSYKLIELVYSEKPKMIVAIRDLREIFASMEQGIRNTPLRAHPSIKWDTLECTTLKKRMQSWSMTTPLGSSLDRLRELINHKNDKDVFFLKYEDLTTFPDPVIRGLYNYLEIPFYQHDFNNIEQTTDQNDALYTFSHKIRKVIEPLKPKAVEILGENLCDSIYEEYEWFFKYFNYTK